MEKPQTEMKSGTDPVAVFRALGKGVIGVVVPSKVNRNAKLFLVGGVLNGLSNGVFNTILQLYLASLGFTGQSLGSIFMMNALATTILTMPAGILADRYGKKPILIIGLASCALSMAIFFSSTTVEMFALSFLLVGVCNASGSVLTPLYSGFFDAGDMDKAFGFSGLINLISLSVGSLVGFIPPFLVLKAGMNLTGAYFLTMSSAGALFIVQNIFFYLSSTGLTENLQNGSAFNLKLESFVLKVSFLSFLSSLADVLTFGLFPYYVNLKFGVESSVLGTMFFASNLGMAISKGAAASLSKKLGGLRSISTGITISAICVLLMPFSPGYAILTVLFIIRCATRFMSDPLISSIFMKNVLPEEKSTANSIRLIGLNRSGIIGPYVGGTLMDQVSIDAAPVMTGILTLMVAGLYPVLLRKEAKLLN